MECGGLAAAFIFATLTPGRTQMPGCSRIRKPRLREGVSKLSLCFVTPEA
jgi:hypothetical protein